MCSQIFQSDAAWDRQLPLFLASLMRWQHHLQMQMPPDFFFRSGLKRKNMRMAVPAELDLRICQEGGLHFGREVKKAFCARRQNFCYIWLIQARRW